MDQIKFLTDLNIQEIIGFIVDDDKIEYDEAMDVFYNSATFEKLTDPETGLYLESAATVYEIFKAEQETGKIVQAEE
ncbi:MAG: hypothetical protein NC303_05850 [Firmicutes bacterium]|nr:hypothetical protein [Bacillota bacterium]MCM1393905.1 hypothetical protein [[Eubacterium] siraeum]